MSKVNVNTKSAPAKATKPLKQPFLFVKLLADNSNRVVSIAELAKALGVSEKSVPVKLFYARRRYDLKVVPEVNGRKVVGWKFAGSALTAEQLANGDYRHEKLVISKRVKKPATSRRHRGTIAVLPKPEVTKAKPEIEIMYAEPQDMDIQEITDTEMSDIRADLGIDLGSFAD